MYGKAELPHFHLSFFQRQSCFGTTNVGSIVALLTRNKSRPWNNSSWFVDGRTDVGPNILDYWFCEWCDRYGVEEYERDEFVVKCHLVVSGELGLTFCAWVNSKLLHRQNLRVWQNIASAALFVCLLSFDNELWFINYFFVFNLLKKL